MQLTISSLDRNQIKAVGVVDRTFNVPRTMLRDRRAGVPVQSLYGKFYDQRLRWRKKARTANGSHQMRSWTTRSRDKGVQPRHDAHGSHQRDGRKGRISQEYRSHQWVPIAHCVQLRLLKLLSKNTLLTITFESLWLRYLVIVLFIESPPFTILVVTPPVLLQSLAHQRIPTA